MQIIYNNSNSMLDLINKIEYFNVYKNGNITKINSNTSQFFKISQNLSGLFVSAHLEPAFGVSLHELTLNELKNGQWLEINFNTTQEKNGMPFNSLLIKLEETGGFNLIRKFNEKYDGRCLYLTLEKITDLTSVINY